MHPCDRLPELRRAFIEVHRDRRAITGLAHEYRRDGRTIQNFLRDWTVLLVGLSKHAFLRVKSSPATMNTKQLLLESISDPGEQLGGATRDFMESRFDADLGDIRIHRSATSDSVNRASGSLAYAVDNHIGFKTGFDESCGKLYLYVLAHELVHVLQKRAAKQAQKQTPGLACVLEEEADRIACEVLCGTRLSKFTADSPEIVRFWGPAGHYWTVYLVSLAAGWSRHAALTNAFYAQMPDQVDELDATEAGEDYVKTYVEKLFTPKAASETFSREISKLKTDKVVQRGLHALTGRIGKDETNLRQATLKRLHRGTFEFALALHPFGDSFAHRTADTDNCLMYNPPFGHAVEIAHFKDPHSPDNLHLHRQLYVHYGLAMFDLLANSPADKGTKEKKAKLEAQLDEVAKEADDERQISKIIAITCSHSGYRPEKEKLLPWEKFHANHRHLGKNLLNQALRWARAWST